MALFGRAATGRGGGGPDPEFPMLDRDRAATFRRAVVEGFRSRGTEVVVEDGSVRTADGGIHGLHNIVRICARTSSDAEMRRAVDAHLASLLDGPATTDPDPKAFRDSLRLRLSPDFHVDFLTEKNGGDAPLYRPFGPGVDVAVVRDTPSTVVTPAASALLRHGDTDEILRLATENTWGELVGSRIHLLRAGDEGDEWVMAACGNSFYTATAAAYLPRILDHWHPGLDLSRGVLFSVPFRHRMYYRVVDSPGSVTGGLREMAVRTVVDYRDEPGGVSPCCFLWHRGEITRVSEAQIPDDPTRGPTVDLVLGPHLDEIAGNG